MNAKKLTGVAVALAAASMFATATVSNAFAAEGGKVKCEGGNECKGKGACKTAKNECSGKNACKGQGYVEAKDAKACTDLQAKNKAEKK
jgi:hypothetical protein